MILPDSSCWVEFLRQGGDEDVIRQIKTWLASDEVATCGAVQAEVLRGIRKPDLKKARRVMGALRYLESIDADWTTVTRVARALADVGQVVPLVDVLIAAIAARHGATLAHRDAHYNKIRTMLPFDEENML